MKIFRIQICFKSSLATPLRSDTLFGYICWIYRYWKGEEALLRDILQNYDENPVIVVSEGLPSGYFPYPVLPPMSNEQGERLFKEFYPDQSRSQFISFLSQMKKLKKTRWIELSDLEKIRDELSSVSLIRSLVSKKMADKKGLGTDKKEKKMPSLVPHNTINRLSGSVEKLGGGFYHTVEIPARNAAFDVYLMTSLNWDTETVNDLFRRMGQWGYGKDRSLGKGRFDVQKIEKCDFPEAGNAVLSLSYFVPDTAVGDGYYDLETKYGKLGGSYSQGAYAYPKTPVLMLRPGAVFRVKEIKACYGKSIGHVHPVLREVRHQTYLFPYFVNLREAE